MNQLSPGPHDSHPIGPDTAAGTATAGGGNAAGGTAAGGNAAPLKKDAGVKDNAAQNDAPKNDAAKYDAVAGPFTIRDLTVFGSTLLMFVASLLPMFGERYNLWNLGNLFFLLLGIILPLVVVALFVARRLQPGTIVRIGSLSVDQFASVTASFAFPLFFLTIANSFNGGVLLGLIGSAGLLAATVLAPHLPWLSADFKGRAETPAHVVAREAAVPSRKPAAPKAPKAPNTPKPSDAAGSSTGFQSSTPRFSSTPGVQGPAPGYQAPVPHVPASHVPASHVPASHVPGTAAAAASTGVGAGAAGAATGASPFAPPASYGTTPSPATEASAVVHSADAKPGDGTGPASSGPATGGTAATGPATGASPATSSPEKTEPAGEPGAKETHLSTAGSAAAPATTQHATNQHPTQPATTQHAAQQTSQPAAQQPWAATMATPIVSGDTRRVSESIGATVDPASRPEESDSPQYEAFWFAVGQPRTAYDEHSGTPAFTIEPGGWVLALEDRGHEFLVQDTDGKVGVLRELSNIERG